MRVYFSFYTKKIIKFETIPMFSEKVSITSFNEEIPHNISYEMLESKVLDAESHNSYADTFYSKNFAMDYQSLNYDKTESSHTTIEIVIKANIDEICNFLKMIEIQKASKNLKHPSITAQLDFSLHGSYCRLCDVKIQNIHDLNDYFIEKPTTKTFYNSYFALKLSGRSIRTIY